MALVVFNKNDIKQRIAVATFFPEDGVSDFQKAQIIGSQNENGWAVGVKSDFDFCQTSIKRIFQDSGFYWLSCCGIWNRS